MKMQQVLDWLMIAVSFLSAWDISRAWSPTCESPISPSISALGTSAATVSTTTMSTALLRTSISAMFSASSPQPGCEMRRLSRLSPSFCAYEASNACSASMKAAVPPARWALAAMVMARVVLPDDSGPKISMILPRGTPPIPRAMSTESAPVEIDGTLTLAAALPSFMMAPWPNCFSICDRATSSDLPLPSSALASLISPFCAIAPSSPRSPPRPPVSQHLETGAL